MSRPLSTQSNTAVLKAIAFVAGPVAYPKNKWGWQTYKISAGILAQGENIIAIANIMGDYKGDLGGGEAGPAEEALAQNYNWGWCMAAIPISLFLLFDLLELFTVAGMQPRI